MTKKDMAKTITEELGLSINVVREAIQMVLDGITDVLVDQSCIRRSMSRNA